MIGRRGGAPEQQDVTPKTPDFGFQWHVTDRCNLRCRHCYQHDFSNAADAPLATLKRIADRIFSALADRAVRVTVTGGEPMIWAPLVPFLEHLAAWPHGAGLDLITNGTLADRDLVMALARIDRLDTVKISLESCEADVNDAVRGAGEFDRVRKNLPRWRDESGKKILLMMTLGRHNIETLEATVSFARDLGLSGIILERFVPLGTGASMSDWALSEGEWRRAATVVAGMVGIDEASLSAYRAFRLRFSGAEIELDAAACNLGAESMAVLPDGSVYPCRRLPVPLGRLPDDDLARILGRLADFAAGEPPAAVGCPQCPAMEHSLNHGQACFMQNMPLELY